MKVVNDIKSLQKLILEEKQKGQKVALVPTMGYLHEGHLSLVSEAAKHAKFVIVSIYVNPSQFNDPKDFENYPSDLSKDKALLSELPCDLLWLPQRAEIENLPLPPTYEVNQLDQPLEGLHRPGHFKGVIEVVYRLFEAVNPNLAFFGEKDYQQLKVIQALVKNNELPINVVSVHTSRDADGLAKSSRNVRLNEQARKTAPQLYAQMKSCIGKRENALIQQLKIAIQHLTTLGFEVEYFTPHEFETGELRLFSAVKLNGVRLIDNIQL